MMNDEHRLVQLLLRCWPFPRGAGRIVDRYFSEISFKDDVSTVETTDGFNISVPPNDAVGRQIYLTGQFDRSIVEILVAFSTPGDTLLDIGANLGYVSACFLKNVADSTVIAVEPQPLIVDLLQKNLHQFGERQRVFPIALSDQDGDAWFYVDPQNKGRSRLVSRAFEGSRQIETRSTQGFLNDLNLERLDLVKIDVEGHEESILRAGKEKLKSLQPKIILFESNQGAAVPFGGGVGLLLNDIGYTVYGLKKRLLSLSLEPLSSNNHGFYNDCVAISRSRTLPPAAIRAFNLSADILDAEPA